MGSKRKTLIALFFVVVLIGSLVGAILYYYHHPPAMRTLIERSLSRSTGASLKIEDLSYSIQPLSLQAKGITVKPGKNQSGFHISIPDLKADIQLKGRFGRKSLFVKKAKIHGFSLRLSEKMTLPEIASGQRALSLLDRVLREMMAFLFFREIKFEAAEVTNGEIAYDSSDQIANVRKIRGALSPDHRIHFFCSTEVEWPKRKMHLKAPQVHMTTDNAVSLVDPEIKGIVRAQKATFESPDGNIDRMELESILIYNHDRKSIALNSLELRLEGMMLKQEASEKPISTDLGLSARGVVDLGEDRADLSEFDIAATHLLDLKGELNLRFGKRRSVSIKNLRGHFLPQKWLYLLRRATGERLAPFNISGPIGLLGEIEGTKAEQGWHWNGDMAMKLAQNRFSYVGKQMQLKGRMTGSIRAEGQFPETNLSVSLKGDRTTFSGFGVALKPLKASLSLSGKYPLYMIEEITVDVPQAIVGIGSKDVRVDDIQVHLQKGTIRAEKRLVSLPVVQFTSSLLRNLYLSLRADENEVAIEMNGQDINFVETALALNLLPSDWRFSGLDAIRTKVVFKENEPCEFNATLGLTNFVFEDQEAVYMGEGIFASGEAEAAIDLKRARVSGYGSLSVNAGEILYDRFYLDLGKNPLSASVKGDYQMREESMQLSSLELGLKDVLGLGGHGNVLFRDKAPSVDFSMRIGDTVLHPIFHHFISEPFGTESSFFGLHAYRRIDCG
jgi:hypothetical protein